MSKQLLYFVLSLDKELYVKFVFLETWNAEHLILSKYDLVWQIILNNY